MPGRNDTGTNTAISTAVVAMIGPVTSSIPALAPSSGVLPPSICRLTFSTTTIASSTTSPTASTMPSRLMVLIEKPATFITPRVPIKDTGMEMPGEAVTNIVVSYLI